MPSLQPPLPDVLGACEEEIKEPLAELYKRLVRFSRLSGGAVSDEQHELLAGIIREVEGLHGRVGQLFAAERDKREEARRPRPPAESKLQALPDMAPAVGQGDKGRFMVLLVDGDANARAALQEMLSSYFDVRAAGDTIEGARLARELHPDVVVTDLSKPQVDDFSLLSVVRDDEELCHVPLLVVSGVSDTEAKVRAFELGAFDYLTKPVATGEVIARIRNAIVHSEDLRRERALQSTDDLTGLANRRYLRGYLTLGLRNAARTRSDLTVVMLDQDNLKQINDQFGHAIGDAAIHLLARALRSNKRGTDCAARIGGDEFVVVMPESDRAGGECFIRRVEEELRRSPLTAKEGVAFHVGASFGVASASDLEWSESCEEILQRADRALYEAKRARKAIGRLKLLG